MLELERAVLALAQPAEVQLTLFADFVCKADELALDFDDGLSMSRKEQMSSEQRAAIDTLDQLLARMSGEQNAPLWTEEALRSGPVWEEVRSAAKAVAAAFGWTLRRPPPSGATYIPAGD